MMRLLLSLLILIFISAGMSASDELQDRKDSLKKTISFLCSEEMKGRLIGTPELDKCADFIEKQFAEAGLEPIPGTKSFSQKFDAGKNGEYKLRNVIGFLKCKDDNLKDSFIIVSAHYDHIGQSMEKITFPGADDNASGVAALIEIARCFAAGKYRNGKTLVFIAFSGEENHAMGAHYFVGNPVFPLDKLSSMYNLEMLGVPGELGKRQLWMTGSSYSNMMENFLPAGWNPEWKLHSGPDISDTLFFTADNIPFAMAKTDKATATIYGFPAHSFTVWGQGMHLHTPDDAPEIIDFDNLAEAVDFISQSIEYQSSTNYRTKWRDGASVSIRGKTFKFKNIDFSTLGKISDAP